MVLHPGLSRKNPQDASTVLGMDGETPVEWQSIMKSFEECIAARDLVLIKHKMEVKRFQTVFRTIYLRLITLLG